MSRRHFMRHLAGASALVLPAFAFTRTLRANAPVAEQATQVGDSDVAGRRAADDRHVGPEAGRADGRAAQADRHHRRLPDLREAAEARQADEAPVDRAVDEHARGRPRARPLLHAHRLTCRTRASSIRATARSSPTSWRTRCRSWRFRRSCRSAGRAKGRASWAWRTRRSRSTPTATSATREMSVPWQRMVDRLKLLEAVETRFIDERRGSGGRGARQGAREDAGPAHERADEGVPGPQRAAGHADEVRRHERRPRLPDGAAAGGGGRAVCGSRLRRLGLASELLHDARDEAAGAGPGVRAR